MNTLPYEAQTALVSFITAFLVGGSVSLLGAGNVLGLARLAVATAIKHRMATMVGVSAVSGLGALGARWFLAPETQMAGFLSALVG